VLLPFGNDGFYNDRHKNNQNNSEKVSKRKKEKKCLDSDLLCQNMN
jgi:hypothetical protein